MLRFGQRVRVERVPLPDPPCMAVLSRLANPARVSSQHFVSDPQFTTFRPWSSARAGSRARATLGMGSEFELKVGYFRGKQNWRVELPVQIRVGLLKPTHPSAWAACQCPSWCFGRLRPHSRPNPVVRVQVVGGRPHCTAAATSSQPGSQHQSTPQWRPKLPPNEAQSHGTHAKFGPF
jgi:hypothetical protein